MPTEEQVHAATTTFQLLADPTRLRIVYALLHGEHSVGDLARLAGAAPASASQHLAKLRLARVVTSRRASTKVFYRASDVHVRQLLEEALFHADHVVSGNPDHAPTRRDAPPEESASPRSVRQRRSRQRASPGGRGDSPHQRPRR